MDEQQVLAASRHWVETVVIGLNLCPFASRPFQAGTIRYALSPAGDARALRDDLADELKRLAATPAAVVETTLLIHPNALTDFLDYNDFLDDAERLVRRLGLEGTIQVASFHPRYQFADAAEDAVENYTNRSPYPMLHLLREESVSAVVDALGEEVHAIPLRNVETLRRLGREKVLELYRPGPSTPSDPPA